MGCNTILNDLKSEEGLNHIMKMAEKKEREECMDILKGILSQPFNEIKDRIILRVVNSSSHLLKNRPHKTIHKEYTVIFQFIVREENDNVITSLIPDLFFMVYPSVTTDMLYEVALENTKKIFPYAIIRCVDPIMGWDFLCSLTNKKTAFGAASILYDEALEELSEILGGSYWLLPASTDEWMVAPKILDYHELKTVVASMNQVIGRDKVLGQEPLFYDATTKSIIPGSDADQKIKNRKEK